MVKSDMGTFDAAKIKLIIWDLDDTFWKGTLSEENIEWIPGNVDIVKTSVDCGIVNSICSKNDYETVRAALQDKGVLEHFVYPSINWEPKGNRVKEQIQALQLRDANVLFIDDNISNLNEVKFYNPNIMTLHPDNLPELAAALSNMEKKDTAHTRLAQYKILEQKLAQREQCNSNLDFLRSCDIKVQMLTDCAPELERIHEMILRTNQLNYTKKRITIEELEQTISDPQTQCGYVQVQDNFGDYGIVGFFCVRGGSLEHFLFSCRCMGMGIEQYVYAMLGFPRLSIVGDVSIELNTTEKPDYINVLGGQAQQAQKRAGVGADIKLLFKGPCDMGSIFSFIEENENITCEFTYVSEETGVSIEQHNHSQCVLQSLTVTPERLEEIMAELPFADKDMYKQTMFEKKYDIVFYSLLTDCALGIYQRNETKEYVGFSQYSNPLTDPNEWQGYIDGTTPATNCKFDLDTLKNIAEKYTFVGRLTPEQIVENVKAISQRLDKSTVLVLLLGSEIPYAYNRNPNYNDRHLFHKKVNDLVKSLALSNPQIRYIEYTKLINSQNDFYDNINHYMKPVYYRIAEQMMRIVREVSGTEIKKSHNRVLSVELLLQYAKRTLKRFLRRY